MKTTLLAFLVSFAAVWAQAATGPGSPPAPAGAAGDARWDVVPKTNTVAASNLPPADPNFDPAVVEAINRSEAAKAEQAAKTAPPKVVTTSDGTTITPLPPGSPPRVTPRPQQTNTAAAGTNVPAAVTGAVPRDPTPTAGVPPPGATLPPGGPPVVGAAAPLPGVPPPGPGAALPGARPPAPGAPVAGSNAPPVAPGEQLIEIKPPPGASNAPPEEVLPAGTINFPATDLNQVLVIYAELVNRTILRPTSLPAPTITLKTQTPLTRREAVQAFDAVLALNGIAMVNIGDKFVKAMPMGQAGQAGAAWSKLPADQLPDLGQFVTHVVQLKYSKPTELVTSLQPFASAIPNPIVPIDSSQILVLRDYSENVKRMLEMIKQIDVVVPSEYISEVIPIKYALASEIASALNSLSTGGGGTTVGGGTTGGTTGTRTTTGTRPGTSPYGSRTGTGYPGSTMPGATPFGSTSTMPGQQPGATGSSFSDRLQRIIQRASVSGDITVLGQTKIIADERTNSLLIFASREDMKMIKDIVSKLDVVLAQVLIEAVIIEVSLNHAHSIGVSYVEQKAHTIGNDFSGIGAINNSSSKNPLLTPGTFASTVGTNAFGNLPGGFSYLGMIGNDLFVSITAAASDGRAKILQRPKIQTSHAVPATLFVGEQRPYPVSSYYGGGAYGGYASIQQLQIGVTLEVTPLINPDGLVVMDIHQKIDSFKGNVTIANVGEVPVTSSKDATAKVAVRDHDTIMLGGLIEKTKNQNNSGVPILKDIPLLGVLFRSTSADETQSELIVLIRPTVLPTPEVAALAAKTEKDHLPGVRALERETQDEESKRMRAMDKMFDTK